LIIEYKSILSFDFIIGFTNLFYFIKIIWKLLKKKEALAAVLYSSTFERKRKINKKI